METKIKCPKCDHQFNVESALSEGIREELNSEFKTKLNEELEALQSSKKDIEAQKARLQKQEEAFQDQLKAALEQKESEIEARLKKDLESESKESIQRLQTKLDKQTSAMSELKREKLDFQEKAQALEQKARELDLEVKEKVLAQTEKIKEDALKAERERKYLEEKEKDMKMKELQDQIKELERKAAQGSQQSQGEVLELEVENLLTFLYPQDSITEVKKGVNGADCLQEVRNKQLKTVGTIAYETKRTKSFSESWIEKLKTDMRNHGAAVGVLVTEVMPKDMETFGERNGVWVCKFNEVEGLSRVLRHSIIKLSEAKLANENSGEKMQILYNYLTSEEFKQQMEAVVNGYTNLKSEIDKEKRSMKNIWKRREKQLDLIIDGAIGMHGSIKAIAGASVAEIEGLEMDVKLIDG